MDEEGKMTAFCDICWIIAMKLVLSAVLPSAVRRRFIWQTLLLQWITKQK